MKLDDVDAIYDVAETHLITRHVIPFEPARQVALALSALLAAVDDYADDELWISVTRRFKRTLRQIVTVPLPINHAAMEIAASAMFIEAHIQRAAGNYPNDLLARAQGALAALRALSSVSANPLGDFALRLIREGTPSRTAILVRSSPLRPAVQEWLFKGSRSSRLLSEGDLQAYQGLDRLVAIGPASWFANHVVSAPRAATIDFLHYEWLRDPEPPPGIFAGAWVSKVVPVIRRSTQLPADTTAEFDIADLAPPVDWDALSRTSGGRAQAADGDPDLVEASLFLLAGGFAVYLDVTDGSRTTNVVDPDTAGGRRFRAEPTRTVDRGSYVVLRSLGSSGDYLEAIANGLLGAQADRLRSLQRKWKTALRECIRRRGFSQTERELGEAGMSAPNLRYRISPRSIRTDDPKDFRLLMEYVGLKDEADMLWNSMQQIAEAHQRGGRHLRQLLVEKLVDADMDRLRSAGWMDIQLDEGDAGQLSILRVERKSPNTIIVPENRIGVLEIVDPDLWQE